MVTMSGMPQTAVRPPTPEPNGVNAAAPVSSAPAARVRRASWRDPRLAVGLLLVAVATLTGARLLATADDTVAVWATAAPVRAGDAVTDVELVPSRVRLDDAGAESAYLPADRTPSGVFDRDLAAGELVPVAALEQATVGDRAELSLAVAVGDAPVDLSEGDLVDVYAVPDPTLSGSAGTGRAERVLEQVPVVTVRSGSSLGDAAQQVVVGLDDKAALGTDDLGDLLGALAPASVVLVRVGA